MSQEGTFIDMYCKVLLFSIVFVVILKIIVYVKNHDGIVHTDSYESITCLCLNIEISVPNFTFKSVSLFVQATSAYVWATYALH